MAAAAALIGALAAVPASGADPQPGGATPQDLMDRLGAAAAVQDVPGVVACIAPDDRPFLSFMLGMVSVEMTGAMIARMAAAPGDAPPPELETRLRDFDEGYQALLARHGVERFEPATEADMRDPVALAELARARLGDVDHAAFIADAMAFLESAGVSRPDSEHNPLRRFQTTVERIDVDGDHARVQVVDVEMPIELTRVDGRWYLLLVPKPS